MRRIGLAAALAATLGLTAIGMAPAAHAQTAAEKQASREATRERLRTLLAEMGPKIGVEFHQSDKNPWNFSGVKRQGLKTCDALEIVIGVSTQETVAVMVYPHYKGGYLNLDKVFNPGGFARRLLKFNDNNFLSFGADDSGDVFQRFTITLESGFPVEAMRVVLYSVSSVDGFVGQMKPLIDGSPAV